MPSTADAVRRGSQIVGAVTASLILRKLGSYPRQNSLAAALREIGRIERTFFTHEWLQDPELRRRVQVGLNKGEAKNALARAVFFNRLGETSVVKTLSGERGETPLRGASAAKKNFQTRCHPV